MVISIKEEDREEGESAEKGGRLCVEDGGGRWRVVCALNLNEKQEEKEQEEEKGEEEEKKTEEVEEKTKKNQKEDWKGD